MKLIIAKLLKQADTLHKKGFHKEALKLDMAIERIAEMPSIYDILGVERRRAPGYGGNSLRSREPEKKEEPKVQPAASTNSKKIFDMSKEELKETASKNPSLRIKIKDTLVRALSLRGDKSKNSEYANKSIDVLLEEADKLGMLGEAKPWYQKIF